MNEMDLTCLKCGSRFLIEDQTPQPQVAHGLFPVLKWGGLRSEV